MPSRDAPDSMLNCLINGCWGGTADTCGARQVPEAIALDIQFPADYCVDYLLVY